MFYWDLYFVHCPTHNVHKIKCPTKKWFHSIIGKSTYTSLLLVNVWHSTKIVQIVTVDWIIYKGFWVSNLWSSGPSCMLHNERAVADMSGRCLRSTRKRHGRGRTSGRGRRSRLSRNRCVPQALYPCIIGYHGVGGLQALYPCISGFHSAACLISGGVGLTRLIPTQNWVLHACICDLSL